MTSSGHPQTCTIAKCQCLDQKEQPTLKLGDQADDTEGELFREPPSPSSRKRAANKKLHQLPSQLQKPAIEEYPGTNILSDTDRTWNTNPIRSPQKTQDQAT